MSTEQLKQSIPELYNGSADYLAAPELREKALAEYTNGHFPGPKDEAWRHTDFTPVLQHTYSQPGKQALSQQDITPYILPGMQVNRLVFVNGFYQPELSEIHETNGSLAIKNLATAKQENSDSFQAHFEKEAAYQHSIFDSLNTAFAKDGLFIHIAKGKQPEYPVHLLNINHPNGDKPLVQLRNLLVVEAGAQLQVIESHHSLSQGVVLKNQSTELQMHRDSVVEYEIIQSENDSDFHINNLHAYQYENSEFNCRTLTLCGGLVRNQLHVQQQESHCRTNLHGLYLADKKQQFDNYVNVEHLQSIGESTQVYRGISDDEANIVYFGKVYVKQDAQQIESEQSNKNILLSPAATAYSKPQLEIYADDVSCAHGSTTGQLNPEELFYLQARGIEKRRAQTMLLYAFAQDIINQIHAAPLREHVTHLMTERLSGGQVENHCAVLFERPEAHKG